MRILHALGAALVAAMSTGCIAAGGGREVVYDEAIRMPVAFESPLASSTFHTSLADASRDDFKDSGGFFILFIAAGGGDTFHETQFYNAQVRIADADRNRVISEAEATSYASFVESRPGECD